MTTSYLETAMAKLRANKQLVRHITVSASTSRFSGRYNHIQNVVTLPVHTNDTLLAAQHVSKAIKQCFESHKFVRSMVCLSSLQSDKHYQADLLHPEQSQRTRSLMTVIDTLNRHNQKKVFLARSLKKTEWDMKRLFKSPEYTTSWKDLPRIKC